MELIETSAAATGASIGETSNLRQVINRVRYWLIRQRRKLPYLVWWNDELDVTITLSQDKLPLMEFGPNDDPSSVFKLLNGGAFAEIESTFREMGITFDKGMGCEGRDWEWDWSLKGPINVRFHGRASRPNLRMERSKPKLVVTSC